MFKDTFIIWKMRKHFMMITSQGQGGEGWPRGLLPPPVESVRAAGTAYRNLFTSVLLVLLPGIFLRCYLQTERGGGETWIQEEGNDSSVQCLAALPPIPARARKGEIERAGNFL